MKQIFQRIEKRPIHHKYKENGIFYKYNKNHKREEVIYLTDNLEIANKYIAKGWKKRRVLKKIILFAPEVKLIDLFDPFEMMENGGFVSHLILYKTIKSLERVSGLKEIINHAGYTKFCILKGCSIEFQTRIALFEKDDMFHKKIKRGIMNMLDHNTTHVPSFIVRRKIDIQQRKTILSGYLKLKKAYCHMTRKLEINESIYGFADKLDKILRADYYLLVPHSGFKFLDDFSKKFGYKKILFYEKHFSQEGDFWVKKVNLKKKRVVIFDVSYSGNTLNWIADIVQREGGKPIKIAVFPKSTLAVKLADYVVLLDRIIKTSSLKIEKGWEFKIYNQIMKL